MKATDFIGATVVGCSEPDDSSGGDHEVSARFIHISKGGVTYVIRAEGIDSVYIVKVSA